MTIIKHELRQGKTAFLIWTISISLLLAICVCLFSQIKNQISSFGDMFSSMGAFTDAFGMDQLNIGTLVGYYVLECGNVLGLGGALFAAFLSVSVISKEEKDHTAEFLLTHTVSRTRIILEKLIAVMVQIIVMNVIVLAFSISSMAIIGETIPWKEVLLVHLAYLFLQIEICGVCFGISAFLRRGSIGIGLGLAILLYFLNIISNITKSADFLKYITPYGYCDGATIILDGKLDIVLIAVGMCYTVIGIFVAFIKYRNKDIQ